MTVLTRPGIYQRPVRPSRRVGGLARRDIPVFIGFTQRGPALEPVRIESVRQLEGVFGAPVESSHMTGALRGFFETGGQAAYVLRLVGQAATAASVAAGGWTFTARTRTADLLTRRAGETLAQWQDNLQRNYARSIPDPGGWANGLLLRVAERQDRSVPAHLVSPTELILTDLAGLAAGAVIKLSVGGASETATISTLDSLRRRAVLGAPVALPPGDMRLTETVMDVSIWNGPDRLERFDGVSPGPAHARHFAEVITQSSRYLSAAGQGDGPPAGDHLLAGGSDALSALSAQDWHAALPRQARIDEIALVAAPDLTRQPQIEADALWDAVIADDLCHLPVARPKGNIAARLENAETGAPVENARIEAAGEGRTAISDAAGGFLLEGLTPGLVELRINADGFLPANPLVQASESQSDPSAEDATIIPLTARTDIPVLSVDEIIAVQRAMQDPGTVGDFRVAVLDPPGAEDTPEDLLTWAASVGASARAFAAAPWIGSAHDGAIALIPPSGHVCGAFAAAELRQGVHRAPGGTLLRQAKTVPLRVSDTVAADFLAAGINLIEATPGRGIRLMGGRTLSRAPEWVHVSVRRLFDALERTLLSRLTWAVFEPGNALTRQVLKYSIEQFLERMRLRGMFAGTSAAEAYQVTCDDSVNPPAGQARGELVVEIGIAPTQPYEFITFSLAAQQEAIDVTEGS